MLLLERRALGLVASWSARNAKDAGTEDAQISELIQVRDADVQRLCSAHGEAGNRAVLSIGEDTKAFFHLRQNVGSELRLELPSKRRPEAERSGVAVRHDDDHRFGLSGGDQIIEDESGAAHAAPRVIRIKCPMEQVENRIPAFTRFVSWGRINMQPAKAL